MRLTPVLWGGMAWLASSLMSCSGNSTFMHSKVPANHLLEARALVNPLPRSGQVMKEGKALYEGKGMCVRCHGTYGDGKGIGGKKLHTPPRNFRKRDFWQHRNEGELFWTIKNGSPGTGMLEFQSLLTDQEIWKILRYLATFPNSPEPPQKTDETNLFRSSHNTLS